MRAFRKGAWWRLRLIEACLIGLLAVPAVVRGGVLFSFGGDIHFAQGQVLERLGKVLHSIPGNQEGRIREGLWLSAPMPPSGMGVADATGRPMEARSGGAGLRFSLLGSLFMMMLLLILVAAVVLWSLRRRFRPARATAPLRSGTEPLFMKTVEEEDEE